MSAEEFFQVLADSQLYRAFPWYYQSVGPILILGTALLSFLCMVWISVSVIYRRCKELIREKLIREELIRKGLIPEERKDAWRDAKVHLAAVRALAALLCLWVPINVFSIKYNPSRVLESIDPKLDSLYDLTPAGVQFVVDYLFWAVVLSVVVTLSLWTVSLGWGLSERRQLKEIEKEATQETKTRSLYTSGVLTLAIVAMAFLALVTLITATVLTVRYFDQQMMIEIQKQTQGGDLLPECEASERARVIGHSWEEIILSDQVRALRGKLLVRPAGMSPLTLTVPYEFIKHDVLAPAEHDPIKVIIFPMLDLDLTLTEKKFAADVLRGLVLQFDTGDVRDKINLYLPKPSGFEISSSVWANETANALYMWLRDTARHDIELDKALQDAVEALGLTGPNSQPRLVLVILFRWYPYGTPSFALNPNFYNTLVDKHFDKTRAYLWIVDLVTHSYPEFVSDLSSQIAYMDVLVPPELTERTTGEFKTNEVISQLEKTERIRQKIERLRRARVIEFETKGLFASRDTHVFWTYGVSPEQCRYPLDLAGIADDSLLDKERRPVGLARATRSWAALWGLGCLYPVGLVLAAVRNLPRIPLSDDRSRNHSAR